MNLNKIILTPCTLILLSFALPVTVFAQGTAFSYQGKLNSSGVSANGSYDFAFTLFDGRNNGNIVAGPLTNLTTAVSNGVFTTTIDFGQGVFTGGNYWLDIAVRSNGDVAFSEVTPRQAITPAPYSIMAGSAGNLLGNLPADQLTGTISAARLPATSLTNNEAGVALSGSFSGNGGGLTNLGAGNLTGTLATNNLPPQLPLWLSNQGLNEYQILYGSPERDESTLTPSQPGQVAVIYNGAVAAYYTGEAAARGAWNGNVMFNGSLQVGCQTNMPDSRYTGTLLWANGNPDFQSTNGNLGTEYTLTLAQADPKQATYINFSAPMSGNGWSNIVMSPQQDCQIGIGGWVYGTNTLGGVAIGNDMLIAMNPGHNLIFTTTVDRGNYGCRAFLEYDNANGVWHIPLDVPGNGAVGNPGYQDLAVFDARQKIITMTNSEILLGVNSSGVTSINIETNGNVDLLANNVTIGGNVAGFLGRGNLGGISGGSLWLNVAGTTSLSTLSFGAELADLNRVPFINEDTNANLQIGIYPIDTMQTFDASGRFVDLTPAVGINTTNPPPACALLDLNHTIGKGLLLMNMTKAERDAIPTPLAGLMIYQTDNIPGLRTYNGNNWVRYTEIND